MTDAEFDAFLNDISVCLTTHDFDQWAGRITLPFTMVTQAGPVVSYSIDDLRMHFNFYLMACQNMTLDTIFRTPLSCVTCEDGSVIATYRTELLSHGQRMTAPFTSSATVTNVNGVWRMSAIIGARGHHTWSGHHPLKSNPANTKMTSKTEAMAISHEILASTGTAILEHNFEAFATSFILPHMLTTFDAATLIETRAQMRAIFISNGQYYDSLGITQIVRECVSAEFDGADMIKATYVAHLLAGKQPVKDPFPCFFTLVQKHDVWRVSKSDYALGPDSGITIAINKLKRDAALPKNDLT